MRAYQIKCTLVDSHLPIWRRIMVPSAHLHSILALVCERLDMAVCIDPGVGEKMDWMFAERSYSNVNLI